jgi:hypothetical protein
VTLRECVLDESGSMLSGSGLIGWSRHCNLPYSKQAQTDITDTSNVGQFINKYSRRPRTTAPSLRSIDYILE